MSTPRERIWRALKATRLQGLARVTAQNAVMPVVEQLQEQAESGAAYIALVERCWAVVRSGLEPDAYRDGKWDLDQAIAHRLAEQSRQGDHQDPGAVNTDGTQLT